MKNYCSNRPETRQNHCIKHILGTGLAPAATSGARKINKFDVSRQICKIICLTLVLGASSSSLFGSDPTAGKFYYDGNKMEVEADYVPANGTIDSLANADDQANALVGATGESPFGIYGTSSGDHAAGDGNTDTPYVIGGHSTSSGVTGNTLNVGEAGAEIKLSKTATSEIYAGLGAVAVTGEEPGVVVTGNTLNIKGAVGLGENNDANFYGGRSRSTVGTGGAATSGDVSNNDIEVREAITGTEGLKLIGGQSDATATGLTATSGDVKNNKVTVEAGGDIKTGGATTIIGGSAKALAAGDGTENFGKVSENKVDIKAKITASTAELYGGFTESSGDAAVVNRGTVGGPQGGTNGDGNKLTLDAEKSIEVSGYDSDENAAVLSGGYSAKGNSQYNTLTIRGNITAGTDAGNIDLTGGSSDEGEALNNTLTVGGISVIKSESEKTFGDGGTNSTFISLAGGYAKGATNSNRLEISGTIKSTKNARIELSGGYGSDGSSADGNTLSLLSNSKIISTGTDGEKGDSIDADNIDMYGGIAEGEVKNNRLVVGGETSEDITIESKEGYIALHGGYSEKGSISGNKLVVGGYIDGADIKDAPGSLTINNTSTDGEIGLYGGYCDVANASNDISDNSVTITSQYSIKAKTNKVGSVSVAGGYAKDAIGAVKKNTVTISGKIGESAVGFNNVELYGGFAEGTTTANLVGGSSEIEGNTLTLVQTTGSITVSGYDSDENAAELSGGYSAKGKSQHNKLIIDGSITAGTDAGNIDLTGGGSGEGEASHNILTVGASSTIQSQSEEIFGDDPTKYSTLISLAGGYAKGATNSNRLEISGTIESTKNARIELSGGYGSNGSSADGNTLSLLSGSKIISTGTDGEKGDSIDADNIDMYGGIAEGEVKNNRLVVGGDTLEDITIESKEGYIALQGGYSEKGSISGNKLVVGGYIDKNTGNTIVNPSTTVTITAENDISIDLLGGYCDVANASNDISGNSVTITEKCSIKAGTNQKGSVSVAGGYAKDAIGAVKNNTVTISSDIGGSGNGFKNVELYGGFAEGTGTVGGTNEEGNTLTLDGSITVSGVEDDGENAAELSGGYSAKGNSQHNKLIIDGSITAGTDAGGIDLTGGGSGEGEALNNTLTVGASSVIESGSTATFGGSPTYPTVISLAGGYAKGKTGTITIDGKAEKNTLEISGTIKSTASASIELAGGYGSSDNSSVVPYSSAKDNTLSLLEGSNITGAGKVDLYGGTANNSVTNNKLIVKQGSGINSTSASTGDYIALYGGYSWEENANKNELTVSGNITSNKAAIELYGGCVCDNTKEASNNKVTIEGTLQGSNISLYGGVYESIDDGVITAASYEPGTQNTLIIKNTTLTNVDAILGFQNYEFVLSKDADPGSTIITMKDNAEANLEGANVKVIYDSQQSLPKNGEDYKVTSYDIVLINKAKGSLAATSAVVANAEEAVKLSDAEEKIKPTVSVANNSLLMRVPVVQVNQSYFEQMKSVSETKIASLAMVRNSDGVINHCIENVFAQPVHSIAMFGEASAASNRVNSGSHVDTRGFSAVIGFGVSGNFDESKLLVGTFAEFGSGTYDSHNEYKNAPDTKGEGKTQYIGGGIMGRFSINTSDNSRFYIDGAARAGSAKMDYQSSDVVDYATGKATSYDVHSGYCGLSAGCGHIHDIEDVSINLYCRYIWTHQNGNNTTLSTEKHMEVDSVSSQRVQAGILLSHKVADTINFYFDAGYEHESSGKVNARVNGNALDSPSLRGNVGKGELGLSFIDESITVNVGVQGSVGACRGVAGKLQISFQI